MPSAAIERLQQQLRDQCAEDSGRNNQTAEYSGRKIGNKKKEEPGWQENWKKGYHTVRESKPVTGLTEFVSSSIKGASKWTATTTCKTDTTWEEFDFGNNPFKERSSSNVFQGNIFITELDDDGIVERDPFGFDVAPNRPKSRRQEDITIAPESSNWASFPQSPHRFPSSRSSAQFGASPASTASTNTTAAETFFDNGMSMLNVTALPIAEVIPIQGVTPVSELQLGEEKEDEDEDEEEPTEEQEREELTKSKSERFLPIGDKNKAKKEKGREEKKKTGKKVADENSEEEVLPVDSKLERDEREKERQREEVELSRLKRQVERFRIKEEIARRQEEARLDEELRQLREEEERIRLRDGKRKREEMLRLKETRRRQRSTEEERTRSDTGKRRQLVSDDPVLNFPDLEDFERWESFESSSTRGTTSSRRERKSSSCISCTCCASIRSSSCYKANKKALIGGLIFVLFAGLGLGIYFSRRAIGLIAGSSNQDCRAALSGFAVANKDSYPSAKLRWIMDITAENQKWMNNDDVGKGIDELISVIETEFEDEVIPILTGCEGSGRETLSFRLLNGNVRGVRDIGNCRAGQAQPCVRMLVEFVVFLKGHGSISDLITHVTTHFSSSVVDILEETPIIAKMNLVGLFGEGMR